VTVPTGGRVERSGRLSHLATRHCRFHSCGCSHWTRPQWHTLSGGPVAGRDSLSHRSAAHPPPSATHQLTPDWVLPAERAQKEIPAGLAVDIPCHARGLGSRPQQALHATLSTKMPAEAA